VLITLGRLRGGGKIQSSRLGELGEGKTKCLNMSKVCPHSPTFKEGVTLTRVNHEL
jgi:hypothetical protein